MKSWKWWLWVGVLLVGAALGSGCRSVQLAPDAMLAAENSALDAFLFARRTASAEDPNGVELLSRAYAPENYKQWRYLLRIAKGDANWGPKLEGE